MVVVWDEMRGARLLHGLRSNPWQCSNAPELQSRPVRSTWTDGEYILPLCEPGSVYVDVHATVLTATV